MLDIPVMTVCFEWGVQHRDASLLFANDFGWEDVEVI